LEKFCDSNCVWTDHHPDCKLAQPEQEPVAWVKEDVCEGQRINGRPRKIWWECEKGVGTAFYTHPPQRTEPFFKFRECEDSQAGITTPPQRTCEGCGKVAKP
jgi:hypothetical protein